MNELEAVALFEGYLRECGAYIKYRAPTEQGWTWQWNEGGVHIETILLESLNPAQVHLAAVDAATTSGLLT